MTATFLVGDVRQRMAELDDASFDLILCSPPFLALRSYLPDGHPDKHLEIGSEATPAEFLDTMLELTAEWGRLLAPHGSIAIELGDTYAGSGGAGGDYNPGQLRDGQPKAGGSAKFARHHTEPPPGVDPAVWRPIKQFAPSHGGGEGWPLAKSLVCIPQLYQIALAYGRNPLRSPLTARELIDTCEQWASDDPDLTVPALLAMMRDWIDHYTEIGPYREYERWRIRNLKAWIRSNPPVGALGDKERPATSYIIIACKATDRWFDLDAVRTHSDYDRPNLRGQGTRGPGHDPPGQPHNNSDHTTNAGGAPPRDWTHTIDLILDTELAARAGKSSDQHSNTNGPKSRSKADAGGGQFGSFDVRTGNGAVGAQGVHLRRALEHAGYLHPQDFYDISPKGYSGAHYAVWPPELARRLIDEMCPRHVCTVCGEPRRRIVGEAEYVKPDGTVHNFRGDGFETNESLANRRKVTGHDNGNMTAMRPTVGWSDCGHNTWRPGRVLDPFVGSGTTLAVASGMARDSVGIDLDYTNVALALERVGMWLDIDWPPSDFTLLALGAGDPAGYPWLTDTNARRFLDALVGLAHQGTRHRRVVTHIPQRPEALPMPADSLFATTVPDLVDVIESL